MRSAWVQPLVVVYWPYTTNPEVPYCYYKLVTNVIRAFKIFVLSYPWCQPISIQHSNHPIYITLYCTLLMCTLLYCTELYSSLLFFTSLNCIVLYCALLYCAVLYCALLQLWFVTFMISHRGQFNCSHSVTDFLLPIW